MIAIETTVKGGLPVTLCGVVSRERRSFGVSAVVDDMWIEVRGRRAKWAEKGVTSREWDALEVELIEASYE